MLSLNEYSTTSMKMDRNQDNTARLKIRNLIRKNLLLCGTLAGVFLGVVIGSLLRNPDLSETTILLISYPGELYMRLLKLLILPLIISSLIAGTSSLNAKLNGKIALRTFVFIFLTSAFNALLGVIFTLIIHPGNQEINISDEKSVEDKKVGGYVLDSLLDLGRNIIADNIFEATFQQAHTDYVNSTIKHYKSNKTSDISKMERIIGTKAGTNTIGLVFFCIIFGSVLGTMGSKGKVVKDLFSITFEIIMVMVKGVIKITPIGLCSIIAGKIVSVTDVAVVVSQLGWFIATVCVGILFSQLIVLQLIYYAFIKKNPFKYYFSFSQATLLAFATASAAPALPINFYIMDNHLKLHPSVTRFVMPIGININKNGTALFLASATIFMAQINGIILGFANLVTIWLTATFMSFSSSSVPSTALVLLLMILTSLGIPTKDLPLLFAIDWLVDRVRTTSNMLGDCYTAAVVEKLSYRELSNMSEETLDDTMNVLLKPENQELIV